MPLTGRPGLTNTHVIPAGWEDHHRPVSDDAMPAECTIIRPSSAGKSFNESTARTVYAAPTTVYEGACRVGRDQIQDSAELVADRKTARRRYTVVIPTGTDEVQVDDIVTVTACAGDPALVDKPMQVVGAARGSHTWERVLTVQLQQPITR